MALAKQEDSCELEQLTFEQKRKILAYYEGVSEESITIQIVEENEEFIDILWAASEYGYFAGEQRKINQ